jgi:hypothetical protein
MADRLEMLRRAGVGQFRHLQPDPALREVALPAVPAAVSGATAEDGTWHAPDAAAHLLFTLPEARYVYAVRLKYSFANTESAHVLQTEWKQSGRNDFSTGERVSRLTLPATNPDGRPHSEVIVWVRDTIDQFRVRPDNKPWDFTLAEVVLLVPTDNEN